MGRWALVGLLLQLLDSLRGLLDGSWNSPGAPFGALGGSLRAPGRQKTSKKPPSDTPSSTSPSFSRKFADSIALFPHFLKCARAKVRRLEGGPAECGSDRGGTQGGERSSKVCKFEEILLGPCLVPLSNTPPRGRRIASRIPPGQGGCRKGARQLGAESMA